METSVIQLINTLLNRTDCVVKRPCGQPLLRKGDILPNDLKLFYDKCGGVVFKNNRFLFEIVGPKEMCLINPIIVGDVCEEDISSKWYAVCKDCENNYVSIDLGGDRLGRCYDSFWDRHGIVGDCPIVARSFTELLCHLLYDQGNEQPYWLMDNFAYIGDAYDGM